jgi:hypothetical protein
MRECRIDPVAFVAQEADPKPAKPFVSRAALYVLGLIGAAFGALIVAWSNHLFGPKPAQPSAPVNASTEPTPAKPQAAPSFIHAQMVGAELAEVEKATRNELSRRGTPAGSLQEQQLRLQIMGGWFLKWLVEGKTTPRHTYLFDVPASFAPPGVAVRVSATITDPYIGPAGYTCRTVVIESRHSPRDAPVSTFGATSKTCLVNGAWSEME